MAPHSWPGRLEPWWACGEHGSQGKGGQVGGEPEGERVMLWDLQVEIPASVTQRREAPGTEAVCEAQGAKYMYLGYGTVKAANRKT